MKWIVEDLAAGFALFTRLPVAGLLPAHMAHNAARGVWAYPVVGAAIGGAGGLAHGLASYAGIGAGLAACWTLALLLLLTGALHEDGLADTADGFGGGATRERKLAIMRDSRIGSFGALALVLSLAVRAVAIAALAQAGTVAVALVVAGMLARSGVIVPLLLLGPARTDGLAARLVAVPPRAAFAGIAVAAAAGFALLPGRTALLVLVLAMLSAGAMTWLARRQIGGHTGDVLGATALIIECVVLTALTV